MPEFEVPKFQVADYVVFSGLLLVSAGIGVYHAFAGGKQSTTKEFLLADKSMNVAPVAMSMVASFMSAITLMGNPAEIYNYGTQFFIIGLSYALVIPAAAHFYIPIFYNLNLTSAYEVSQDTARTPYRTYPQTNPQTVLTIDTSDTIITNAVTNLYIL